MKVTKALVLTILLCSQYSFAASNSFQCTYKEVHSLDESGVIKSNDYMADLVGEVFAVDRFTGGIIGAGLTTMLSEGTLVVNDGNDGNSFKAVAFFEGQVQAIEIQSWREAKEFPFIALSMGGVGLATGTCK